jgi:hypothetical protein
MKLKGVKDWLVQYSKTNVMQFLFNLLRIKGLYCFEHYFRIVRRRYRSGTSYTACVLCQLAAPGLECNSNSGAAN